MVVAEKEHRQLRQHPAAADVIWFRVGNRGSERLKVGTAA